MSSPISTYECDDSVKVLTTITTGRRIRYLTITNEDSKPIGIISIGNIVKRSIEEVESMVELITEYIKTG